MSEMLNMALIRCPVGFSEEIITVFQIKKTQNFSIFKDFIHFFPHFRQTLWIGTLKRVNKEKMCCPTSFSDEFIAVFLVKMSQIITETYKNPKTFQYSKFLFIFC